mmetsp:Transcript_16846/g.38621  ORF Transcript_16846/g.38621 Transcript_16846/m.38621 type:complete len:209 (+) Transcript_16846:527-1153(+)
MRAVKAAHRRAREYSIVRIIAPYRLLVPASLVCSSLFSPKLPVRVFLREGSGKGNGTFVALGHARQEFLRLPYEFLFLQEQIELLLDSIERQSLRWVHPPGVAQQHEIFGRQIEPVRANSLVADKRLIRVGSHLFVGFRLGQDLVGNYAPGVNVALQPIRKMQTHLGCHVSQRTDRSGHIEYGRFGLWGTAQILFLWKHGAGRRQFSC